MTTVGLWFITVEVVVMSLSVTIGLVVHGAENNVLLLLCQLCGARKLMLIMRHVEFGND